MDGIVIVDLRGGLLVFERAFRPNYGLSKPTHPMNLAAVLFALHHTAIDLRTAHLGTTTAHIAVCGDLLCCVFGLAPLRRVAERLAEGGDPHNSLDDLCTRRRWLAATIRPRLSRLDAAVDAAIARGRAIIRRRRPSRRRRVPKLLVLDGDTYRRARGSLPSGFASIPADPDTILFFDPREKKEDEDLRVVAALARRLLEDSPAGSTAKVVAEEAPTDDLRPPVLADRDRRRRRESIKVAPFYIS